MDARVRGWIYFVFLTAFLISAPTVVLYTAGFRFSLEGGGIVRTGLLSISTVPKGATVTVDGEKRRGITPLLVDDLVPGEHLIELSKAGYLPWEKTLAITENETTFAHHAVLFLDTPPMLQTAGTFHTPTPDPTGDTVAYALEQEGWSEVWAHQITGEEDLLLLRLPRSEAESLELAWTSDGGYLISRHEIEGEPVWTAIGSDGRFRLDLGIATESMLDSNEQLVDVYADPDIDHRLYLRTNDRVLKLNLGSSAPEELFENPMVAIERGGAILTILPTSDQSALVRVDDGEDEILAYIPSGEWTFLPAPESLVLLHDPGRGRLLLVDARGVDLPILLHTDAHEAVWGGEDNDQLLFISEFEIHVYDVSSHTDELITRVSRPLTHVRWFSTWSEILYVEGTTLYGTEIDRRDTRNTVSLAELDTLDNFWIDQNGKVVFLVGTRGEERGLFTRELVK